MSPMQAKKMIDELPHDAVKNIIYRKGIVNLLPSKVSETLKNNLKDIQEPNKLISVNERLSNSGSTKSDEGNKRFKRERLFSIDSDDKSETHDHLRNHEETKLENSQFVRVSLSRPALEKIQDKSSKIIKVGNDVSQNNFGIEGNPKVSRFIIEEEKVDAAPETTTNENNVVVEEQLHYQVIPIKSSPNFHKADNKGLQNYSQMMNLKTIVLGSNIKEFIGKERTIINQRQLGSLGCLIDAQNKSGNMQLTSLMNPNNLSEDDLFWDNLWLFKKREEEKRVTKEDSDSEDETLIQRPRKIGEIMSNPHILIQFMLQKRFKKLRRKLLFINSIGGLSIMTILFFVQLKYSRRFRFYTKTIIHLSLFAFTALGF